MSKFLVETHYTCTFKIIHELDELNEKELSNIDNRKDGKVEIVRDIALSDFAKEKIKLSTDELIEERAAVKDLLK